ncbi:hypothetical protein MNAN1_002422 [Malassezia nana]|uniref:Cytidyltransferase-like domain-containing protein n=1 Tax=Malassezia nana TaxID=180528 RepID=A0AAF0J2T0_9BASI|nr:hypothetical protein MNAN1_002422 [Malassezia nana]
MFVGWFLTALLSVVLGAQALTWKNDPYGLTEMIPAPKGCWNPDTESQQFTLVVMPDTQYLYDENRIHPVPMQEAFEYVMSCNETRENIVFMAHLGDIAQNGLAEEYAVASQVFDRLDKAHVAYSTLAGNHDIDSSTDDTRGSTPFLDAFGSERFAHSKTYKGSNKGGYNSYHIFRAGGREWLLLALDWRMSNTSFDWANQVLTNHSSLPTILTTHELVTADTGKTEFSDYGNEVWDKLIKHHDQVFLTFNGHFWPPGRTSRKNNAGHRVDAHITNYQNRYYGGAGMIRLYRFDLEKNTIDVSTFSPWIQKLKAQGTANKLALQEANLTTDVDQFTMSVDFKERFSQRKSASKRAAVKEVIPGTLAYWRFDGHANASPVSRKQVIRDLSGHGNDLHYHSVNESFSHTVHWSKSHHPQQPGHGSLNFTGQKEPLRGSYFQTGDDAPLNFAQFEHGYTFEAFYYLPSSWSSTQNAWSSILSRWGTAGQANKTGSDVDADEPIVSLSLSDDRELQWRVYPLHQKGGSTNWGHESPFDAWWHVAVVNNGTRTKMFVDGCEVARNPDQWTPGLTTLNRPWMLGGYEYNGTINQIFYGSIGDVRIVDRALSIDEFLLQSPPFTGAAVTGAGPVTRELAEGREGTLVDQDTSRLSANMNKCNIQSSSRPIDGDVTPWELESGLDDELDEYQDWTQMLDESKTPLVIVACGSFSPPTYLHLRMFEMAKDQVTEAGKYELLAGYYSPVSDQYKKEGLAKGTHRVRMCELAVQRSSNWLMVDAWESLQGTYQRTAVVLDHFDQEINGQGGVRLRDGSYRRIKIMLLAGGDLIQSMGEPGVWANDDLHHILGRYGCFIVERTGADVWSFLLSHDLLWLHRKNLIVVKQTIYNDISSSKVRLFVRRGYSIRYLLPNSVIQYIEEHQLYR